MVDYTTLAISLGVCGLGTFLTWISVEVMLLRHAVREIRDTQLKDRKNE